MGSVSWAIYGRFAQRMGMAVVILIAGELGYAAGWGTRRLGA